MASWLKRSRLDSGTYVSAGKDGKILALKNSRYSILALAVAGLVSGCAKPGPVGLDQSIAVAELASLPVPSATDYSAGAQGDQARPLDLLNVAVFGVPELTREVRVNNGGYFDFPLIGAVQANGRSLAEISFELETRLAGEFVRNPDVTVEFVERIGQVVTVSGEVDKPGQYPILQSMSLIDIVASAGGLTEYSQIDDVLILREIEGQRYIGIYDLGAIQRGNYPDPEVYAHDIVIVGDSPSRRQLTEILRYSQLITNPLILIERAVNNN